MSPSTRAPLLGRGSWSETRRIADILRKETVGGALLLVAAAIALVWANSPWGESYETLRDTRVGPAALHLDLSLGTWAADGLLAVFFFVAGLELKREFVAGDLREPRRAALPIAAAVGGMAVPALLFVLFNLGRDDGDVKNAQMLIGGAYDKAKVDGELFTVEMVDPHDLQLANGQTN